MIISESRFFCNGGSGRFPSNARVGVLPVLTLVIRRTGWYNGRIAEKRAPGAAFGRSVFHLKVDNAIILAAGTSSRFAPLSYERHKALTEVRGEVLIERQIRQLQAAGVPEIYIVTGYRHEQFEYLPAKFGIKLLHNPAASGPHGRR